MHEGMVIRYLLTNSVLQCIPYGLDLVPKNIDHHLDIPVTLVLTWWGFLQSALDLEVRLDG